MSTFTLYQIFFLIFVPCLSIACVVVRVFFVVLLLLLFYFFLNTVLFLWKYFIVILIHSPTFSKNKVRPYSSFQ